MTTRTKEEIMADIIALDLEKDAAMEAFNKRKEEVEKLIKNSPAYMAKVNDRYARYTEWDKTKNEMNEKLKLFIKAEAEPTVAPIKALIEQNKLKQDLMFQLRNSIAFATSFDFLNPLYKHFDEQYTAASEKRWELERKIITLEATIKRKYKKERDEIKGIILAKEKEFDNEWTEIIRERWTAEDALLQSDKDVVEAAKKTCSEKTIVLMAELEALMKGEINGK